MTHKAKKRWALFVLLVGLPVYIGLCVMLADWSREAMGRPSVFVELAIFVGMGVLWAFPLKKIFLGVGQADPNESADAG